MFNENQKDVVPFEIEFIEDEHYINKVKYNVLKEMILPVVKLIESGINVNEAINKVAKARHLNHQMILKNCIRLQGFKTTDKLTESVKNGKYKKHLLDKYSYHKVFIESEI